MNLDELEAVARKATPGPWSLSRDMYARVGCAVNVKGDGSSFIADCDGSGGTEPLDKRNAVYIAAFSPEMVLKLIAVARAAQKIGPFEGMDALREALSALTKL